MENTIVYLINSSLFLLCFYLFYLLLMKKETFYKINRFYLLSGGALSLIIPALLQAGIFNLDKKGVEPGLIKVNLDPVFVNRANNLSSGYSFYEVLTLFYLIGAVTLAIILTIRVLTVMNLKKSVTPVEINGLKSVASEKIKTPFTFLNTLFLPKENISEIENVIAHEVIHIKQKHTFDILFSEIIKTILWFNPVAWLYKKELQAQHEFLADDEVIKQGKEKTAYKNQIFSYAVNFAPGSITNNFNSLLRRRIVMLDSKRSSTGSKFKVLLSIPLLAIMILFINVKNEAKVTDFSNGSKDSVYSKVDQQPEYPGGTDALIQFIAKNLHYPELAIKAGIQGKVLVSFVVDKSGKIEDVKIVQGLGSGCDEAAIDVIKSMPKWKPGLVAGKKVATEMVLPIMFKLQ